MSEMTIVTLHCSCVIRSKMYMEDWIHEAHINEFAVKLHARRYENENETNKYVETLLLLKAITVIDLTTLSGDDTKSNLREIVHNALFPLADNIKCKAVYSAIKCAEMLKSFIDVNFSSLEYEVKQKDSKFIINYKRRGIFCNTSRSTSKDYESRVHYIKNLANILTIPKTNDAQQFVKEFLNLSNFADCENDQFQYAVFHVAAICVYPLCIGKVAGILQNIQNNYVSYGKKRKLTETAIPSTSICEEVNNPLQLNLILSSFAKRRAQKYNQPNVFGEFSNRNVSDLSKNSNANDSGDVITTDDDENAVSAKPNDFNNTLNITEASTAVGVGSSNITSGLQNATNFFKTGCSGSKVNNNNVGGETLNAPVLAAIGKTGYNENVIKTSASTGNGVFQFSSNGNLIKPNAYNTTSVSSSAKLGFEFARSKLSMSIDNLSKTDPNDVNVINSSATGIQTSVSSANSGYKFGVNEFLANNNRISSGNSANIFSNKSGLGIITEENADHNITNSNKNNHLFGHVSSFVFSTSPVERKILNVTRATDRNIPNNCSYSNKSIIASTSNSKSSDNFSVICSTASGNSARNVNLSDLNTLKIITNFPIAAVAAGFPSGQFPLQSNKLEIDYCFNEGANEIDIVINRSLVIGHKWKELFLHISQLKQQCKEMTMKTILSVGECGSLENVYNASMVAMMAGTDFIKTSTGKETVNATFPVGVVMCRAILTYYKKTGRRVGFKPAGGIQTSDDVIRWLKLIIYELGADWLPLFRIGASGVLSDIVKRLQQNLTQLC